MLADLNIRRDNSEVFAATDRWEQSTDIKVLRSWRILFIEIVAKI